MKKFEFKECDSCAAKPGSPELCASCLHNRAIIDHLNSELKESKATQEIVLLFRKAGKPYMIGFKDNGIQYYKLRPALLRDHAELHSVEG